ncbi:polyhomeotic-like protein 2 [Lates japonicus]|uniref:Polyhomeotic-like protein 2 n=1 Tax=Lates japonicus TaxID=270547 RepID=A0AAD3RKH3_LATJO|nr:polyhomeotic-like protein 2 [Lates japonicus]
MTSGNGTSSQHNGESKPAQALVKSHVLTHLIEGFVIQEGAGRTLHAKQMTEWMNYLSLKEGQDLKHQDSWLRDLLQMLPKVSHGLAPPT